MSNRKKNDGKNNEKQNNMSDSNDDNYDGNNKNKMLLSSNNGSKINNRKIKNTRKKKEKRKQRRKTARNALKLPKWSSPINYLPYLSRPLREHSNSHALAIDNENDENDYTNYNAYRFFNATLHEESLQRQLKSIQELLVYNILKRKEIRDDGKSSDKKILIDPDKNMTLLIKRNISPNLDFDFSTAVFYDDLNSLVINCLVQALVLMVGVMNDYMSKSPNCKFILLLKGGRSLQMLNTVSNLRQKCPDIRTTDVDLLLYPKPATWSEINHDNIGVSVMKAYEKNYIDAQQWASRIVRTFQEYCTVLKEHPILGSVINPSVLEPGLKTTRGFRGNPLIYKLSNLTNLWAPTPLMDITFNWKEMEQLANVEQAINHSNTLPFFHEQSEKKVTIVNKQVELDLLYIFQSMDAFRREKEYLSQKNGLDERTKQKSLAYLRCLE